MSTKPNSSPAVGSKKKGVFDSILDSVEDDVAGFKSNFFNF